MRKPLAAATVLGLLFAGACSNPSDSANPTGPAARPNLRLAAALQPYDSCDSVMQTIRTQAAARITAYGLEGVGGATVGSMAEDLPTTGPRVQPASPPSANKSATPSTTAPQTASADESSSGGAGPGGAGAPAAGGPSGASPAHSGTNVQEAGVDEPDLVKTDGKRLFALTDGTLRSFTIVDGLPRPAGTLDLTDRTGGGGEQQLLASGDKLLVLTKGVTGPSTAGPRRGGVAIEDVEPGGAGPTTGTQLVEIDASDPAQLKPTSQVTIDGTVVDARLVGGTARVVLESAPGSFDFVRPTSSSRKAQQAAKNANTRIIDESTTTDWLPQYTIAGSNERRPLVDCVNVSRPQQFGGFGMVTVLTVEIGKGINPHNSIAVQADADRVYATTDRLFVSTNRLPEPTAVDDGTSTSTTPTGVKPTDAKPTTGPTTSLRPGIDCDPACPPPSEPRRPTTTRVSPTPEADYRTAIHEFDITGTGPAVYRASGDVRGHVMNDFSLSSRDGFLRVATTDGSPFRSSVPSAESFVSVLHEEDGELKVVGQVGGMGKGEQIKSVRFIGPTGYVVTFRQTDPLYTIDLHNPRDPRVVGELKILGYSAYLHPVRDGLLLGVGQDATDRGRTLGTQVALFDVSNPAEPRQLQKIALPNAHSEAEQDYHAFLYWDPTHLAMIPVQSYGGATDGPVTAPCPPDATCTATAAAPTNTRPFVGAIGFTVDTNGIKELGQVVNPLTDGTTPLCPTAGPCTTPPGPTRPGPTITAVPSTTVTTLPDDPEVRKACIASGACPSDTPIAGGGAPVSSTTQTTSPGSSTTTSSQPSGSSTTQTTNPGSSTTTSSQPSGSSTTQTTTPANRCDPLCPLPAATGTQGAPIQRAVVVGDKVFTLSNTGLVVSELGTLTPLGWLPFT